MLSARELQRRGTEAINSGRIAEAARLLERALDRQPDATTRARALMGLALVRSEQGRGEDGPPLVTEALALAGLPAGVRGLGLSQLGLLHMRSGSHDLALRFFASAEPLLVDDPAALARLSMNRGYLMLQAFRLEEAAADFEQARRLAGDPVEAAKAGHNLGYAEFLSGELVASLRLIEQAEAVLAPLSPVFRATIESDRAEVLAACGLPDEAAEALASAAHAFALRRLRQSQAEAELAQARIMAVQDPVRAVPVARRAARRFRVRGSEDWALRADAVALAAEVAAGRGGSRVECTAQDLHGQLRAHRLRADAQRVALAGAAAALRSGEMEAGRRWLSRARVRPADPMAHRLLDRQARSRLAVRAGRRAAAFEHLRRGLDDLHEWLSAFGSLDLQSALVGHGRGLAAYGLELAVADGRPELVFEWFERARVLVSRVTPVAPPTGPEGAAELGELRRLQGTGADSAELRDRIRRHSWYAPSVGPAAHPAPLAEVQAALDGAALLGLVRASGQLRALVVTPESAWVVPLGVAEPVLGRLPLLAADLDMAASDLPPGLDRVVAGSLRGQLEALDAALVAPVAGLLGDRPLVVVPAASLSGVPWTLLPTLAGRPVTVPRSATHWLATHRAPRPATVGFVTGPGVPRAGEEVSRSAVAWTGQATTVALDATAEEVTRVASEVDVLHVAAHGRHSAESPLFSGIELRGGPWFGHDIDQLAAVPSVVLLSACELGRSTVRGHEELVGMTTAWLHAGSRCVLASPVAVNDAIACELLPLVHAGLAGGRAPAEALADAGSRVDALAAFSCYGSGW